MSSQNNGSGSDPTDEGSALGQLLSTFGTIANDPEKRGKLYDAASSALGDAARGTAQTLKDTMNGKAATPPAAATPPETTDPAKVAVAPSTTEKPAAAAKAREAAKPATPEEQDHMNWITEALWKFLPEAAPGVHEWAINAGVPLVAQGQHLMKTHGKPPVSNNPVAFIQCLRGDKITVIPDAVQEYSNKILAFLNITDNEKGEMATAISMGFISLCRQFLAPYGQSFGIQAFNDTATVQAPSFANLLGFGTNANTLLSLVGLAPGNQPVDSKVLEPLKKLMKKKGVENVDDMFSADMSYRDFIGSYAEVGRQMKDKWTLEVSEDTKKKAKEILEKHGFSSNPELVEGLARSATFGADMVKLMRPDPETEVSTASAPKADGPA